VETLAEHLPPERFGRRGLRRAGLLAAGLLGAGLLRARLRFGLSPQWIDIRVLGHIASVRVDGRLRFPISLPADWAANPYQVAGSLSAELR
jgi:hypothetical protein